MSEKRFSGLTKNTFLLTLTSLFADISTEMLYPILPVYLTQTLHAGGSIVGLVEGVAVATQNIIQGFSGWLSDKLNQRKPIALAGYLIAAISKPLIGLSSVWPAVLGARFLDRLGTGTRSAPRDALIASSTTPENRGKAFGLEGIGDNLGAFIGPLLTVLILAVFKIKIQTIFFLSIFPGLLAVLMVLFVKDQKVQIAAKSKLDFNFSAFPKSYYHYLFVTALFGLGNISSSFLILATRAAGVSLSLTIIIYAFFNLTAALISYPSGTLSDKIGRRNILFLSLLAFLFCLLGFALTQNLVLITILFLLYGLYQGVFRSVGKAFATDFVPAELRASGIGWYNTVIGLSSLAASLMAGATWDKISHPTTFFLAAAFIFIGSLSLFSLPNRKQVL